MKTNNQIRGDLSVCCSAMVAGGLTAGGNAVVKGNLRVEGWLDARNLRQPCKGLFADAESLIRACPRPMPGWWALVGAAFPASIYIAVGGRWEDTGRTGGDISVDLDAYDAAIEAVNDRVNELDAGMRSTDHPVEVRDVAGVDLVIADENGNAIVTFAGGHIRTAAFNSANIASDAGNCASGSIPSSVTSAISLPGKWCALGTSITNWDNHRRDGVKGYQYWVKKCVTFGGGYVNKGLDSARITTLASNLDLIVPADYYTLEFGTNDFLGNIPPGTMDDYIAATNTSTFHGAMRMVIERIYEVNPAAFIILCTPRKCHYAGFGVGRWDTPNAGGFKLTAYVDAVLEIAGYESLPVADFFALTNTNRHNLAAHSVDDALHPNTLGHQLMANVLVRQFHLLQTHGS